MAKEQLELKRSLPKAKEKERIYEQMNNEELVSTPTCLHRQGFQYSQCLVHPQITLRRMQTVGSVITTTAAAVVTSSNLSNAISVLEPAIKSFPVHSSRNHVYTVYFGLKGNTSRLGY